MSDWSEFEESGEPIGKVTNSTWTILVCGTRLCIPKQKIKKHSALKARAREQTKKTKFSTTQQRPREGRISNSSPTVAQLQAAWTDSNEGNNQTTHTDTNTNNTSTGKDLGNNRRHRIFDLQTTVGTGAINTQLKANKTNIKAAQGERIVSVVIELESKHRYAKDSEI